jgi:hypothetical protein
MKHHSPSIQPGESLLQALMFATGARTGSNEQNNTNLMKIAILFIIPIKLAVKERQSLIIIFQFYNILFLNFRTERRSSMRPMGEIGQWSLVKLTRKSE